MTARRAFVLVTSALVLGLLAYAVLGQHGSPRSTPKMLWGANPIGSQFTGTTQPPFDWRPVTAFARQDAGGKLPSVLGWGEPFHSSASCSSRGYPRAQDCPFQTDQFNAVREHGMIPLLDWASSDDRNPADSTYTDAAIARGAHDFYMRQFARDAKAWGHPLFLRFDWEMNGSSFNWAVNYHRAGKSAGPNSASQFVAMWRHVHDIFMAEGATNVTWVWCPNVSASDTVPIASVYPGDRYVDWTCLDGYNGNDPSWKTFADLFQGSYNEVTKQVAPHKPMLIGETASTETGGSKAQWITDMLRSGDFPQLYGVLWYDSGDPGPGGHTDWPIESSKASRQAFAKGIQSFRYTTNNYAQLDASPIAPP